MGALRWALAPRSGVLEMQSTTHCVLRGPSAPALTPHSRPPACSRVCQCPFPGHLPHCRAKLWPCPSDSRPSLARPEVLQTWLPGPSTHLGLQSLGLLDICSRRTMARGVGRAPLSSSPSRNILWAHSDTHGGEGLWVSPPESGVCGLTWNVHGLASAQWFVQRVQS